MYRFYKQKVSFSFLVASLLMCFIALRAFTLPGEQAEQGESVIHTHQVLHELEALSVHLADAENGQRGYLLTGSDDYLKPFSQATRLIEGDLVEVQHLTKDNPTQQSQIPLLRERLTNQLGSLQQVIDQNESLVAEARKKPPIITDKQESALIEKQLDKMRTEEYRLLSERMDRWHASVARTSFIFVGSVIALYILICIAYSITRKENIYRKQLLDVEKAETERLLHIVAIQREVTMHRLDLQAAMQSICNRTQMLTQCDGAIVEMVDGEDMVYRAASGTAQQHVGMRIKASTSLSGRCIAENRVLICDDALTDERVDREACARVGLRSMVVVPLRHEGEVTGVLKVLSKTACLFREHHVATLELMASTLSATINDAGAAEALKIANERLLEANTELAFQKTDLQNANIRLEALATTDGLTNLKNHRFFQERLAEEFLRSTRHKSCRRI